MSQTKPRFADGTTINNTDISGLTVEEANSTLIAASDDICLIDGENTYVLCPASTIGSISYSDALLNILVADTRTKEILPVIRYDETLLMNKVKEFADQYNEGKNSPQNAYIAFNDKFEVIPDTDGETLNAQSLYQSITQSLDSNILYVDISDDHTQAEITKGKLSLSDQMTALNELNDFHVNLSGGKDLIIPREKWIPELQYSNEVISINPEFISQISDYIAEHYNTFGTARQFVTHNGTQITTGGSHKDTFGYKLNKEKTTEKIMNDLLAGKSSEAVWEISGGKRNDINDIGNTYAEVSIQDQHMWLYQDGTITFESDVVTGKMANGGTTPGVFQVLYKESPAVLRGDDYETHVSYWMPFTWTGTGFHDASWRSSFGGQIYINGGSHGCVNMPSEKAKELFGIIDAGLPVIVY